MLIQLILQVEILKVKFNQQQQMGQSLQIFHLALDLKMMQRKIVVVNVVNSDNI